jgi:lipopolysaccharide cholinephosphotransferase
MNEKDLVKGKQVMVNILIEIDRICNNNNIDYWIDYGTLLGAVRHGGFIPWDDDIDIVMPRKDYNKFTKLAQEELSREYFFQNKDVDKDNYILATKVRHRKSIYVEYGNEGDKPNGSNGIFVDIFPLERVKNKNLKKINFFRQLYHISPFKPKYQSTKTKFLNYSFSFLYPFRRAFKFIIEKLYDEQGDINICGYEVPFTTSYPYKLIYPIKQIEFEGYLFNCPQHERAILKTLFGDFMQLPPLNQRRTHATEIKTFE